MKFSRFIPFIILIFGAFSYSIASGENYHVGGRAAGMGNSAVTLKDRWGVHHNQAALAWVGKKSAGVYYESRFMTPEMGLQGGAFILPMKAGTFGLSVSAFGYSAYNETKVGLAYARKLSEIFSVGIQLDYMTVGIGDNYGRAHAFTGEIGVLANLTEDLTIGAHIFNPVRTKLADYNDEKLATIIRFGAGYTFSEKVLVTAEMEKDIDHKPVFRSGLEYNLTSPIFIRAGISTNPFITSVGVGVQFKGFEMDFATGYHSVLGYTPQLSLAYEF